MSYKDNDDYKMIIIIIKSLKILKI